MGFAAFGDNLLGSPVLGRLGRMLAVFFSFVSKLTQRVLSVTDWIGAQIHVSSKWASRAGFIVLLGLGMTFIQVDEYGVALVLWVLSAIVLFAKAVHWKGIETRPRVSILIRCLFVLAAIAFVPLSLVWTQSKRGDKPWTAFRWHRSVTARSGCTITPQTQSLRANPMPESATDQQLVNEAMLITEYIIDFAVMDTNAYREGNNEPAEECAILQEYERSIRTPAQAVRRAMLDRLSVQERASLPAVGADAYMYPKDITSLFKIDDDLRAIIGHLDKDKHIEADTPKKQWIIPPIKERVKSLPYTESDTQLSQTMSTPDGYMAEVRWISSFNSPQNLQLLILVKSSVAHGADRWVRLNSMADSAVSTDT
jgi:hypothetical protein